MKDISARFVGVELYFDDLERAKEFYAIRDQHDPAFWHRVCEGANERCQQDEGTDEKLLQQRCRPVWIVLIAKQRERTEQQRVITHCRQELCGENRQQAARPER